MPESEQKTGQFAEGSQARELYLKDKEREIFEAEKKEANDIFECGDDISKSRLIKEINSIGNLRAESSEARYSSWEPSEHVLDKESKDELVVFLLDDKEGANFEPSELTVDIIHGYVEDIIKGTNTELIPRHVKEIGAWLDLAEDEDRHKRIVALQEKIASLLGEGSNMDLPLTALLGEIDNHRTALMNEEALTDALESNMVIGWKFMDQCSVLNRLNNQKGNVLLHKILDFFETHARTIENYTPEMKQARAWHHTYEIRPSQQAHMFAWEEQKHSKNYLIQKHFEDFLSSEYDAKVKPGTVFGTAGGSSDDTIYTFQHLRDAYKNRLALGISKGFPAVNPVLPVAPGYYGYYRAGRLGEVYKADNLDEEKSRERELRYIGENNPEDEYIYDELNGPTPKSFNNYHPSHELHKLEYIWDFRRHLRDKGRSFFYDLERIKDLSKLHPMVLADLVTDNQKYINLAEGKDSQAIEPIAASDFEHELFPLNEASPELAYEYFYLSRPSMRKKLEDDLQMDFSDIPLRSQAQFLHFIEGQSVESFERVKNILTANPDAKLDIIKSFFANAADDAYAETILSIAEQLADDPEAQEELFSKYAQFTDALSDKVHIVQEAHKRIFVFSQLPQSDIFTALVMRANELLVRAEAAIQNQDAASRREIIKKLTENFQNEQETLEEQINEFEKAAAAVREKLKHTNEILRHTPLSRDYAHILDPKELRMEEVIKTIRSKKFKGVSDQFADYLRRDLERQVRQNAKITSELIGSLIHNLRAQMENFSAVNEMTDVLYPDDVDELTGNPQAEKDREDFESKTRPAFIKIIKELSELLKFQKAFEEKFQALITRESEGVLPKGFLSNLEQEVSELKPEALPPEEPLYFPVGISKDLPQWREVFAGEKHAAKPIDMYSYLFWLNNQGKPAQLVVCDEIQISNYQELYGVNKEEAKEGARSIGREEAETYQKIIDTFGLANVEVVDYNTFKEGHEHEIERYRELCEQLAEHPVFRDAFLGMVQESISGTTPEQKKQYLAYGIEELSLILATGGAKVSHQNEARYDTLAAFIKTAQELAIENEETFAGLLNKKEPLEGLTQILNGTIRKMQEKLNDLKKENKNNQEAMQYFTASADVLKGIDRELRGFRGRVADKPAIFKKSFKAKFDFVAPSIGSQSFGWRSKGDKGQKSTVKFREPYSTYFYKEGSEVFLGSDQVVAAPDGLIAGKTLALDDEAQKKYAQETVKPLLSQYFKSLDAAPKAYFEHVGKTQKQLIAECKRSNTLLDVLKFIQRYVVAPSSRNFERSPSGEMLRPATRVEAG